MTTTEQHRKKLPPGSRIAVNYATVASTLALIVALGGVSWAAASLPNNSVGAAQLKSNAVTTPKIKNNAVTTAKVKDGSLTRADLAPGATALEIIYKVSAPVTVAPGATVSVMADCPAGMAATGGGAFGSDFGSTIDSTQPQPPGWRTYVRNDGPVAMDAYGYAACVKASSAHVAGDAPAGGLQKAP